MQQKLYEDAPYLVVAETTQRQAVRTDRFACFQPQPDPGGVWLIQYGGHNYNQLRPASKAGDCDGVASAIGASSSSSTSSSDDGGGSNTAAWVAGGVVVLALVGGWRAAAAAPTKRGASASDAARIDRPSSRPHQRRRSPGVAATCGTWAARCWARSAACASSWCVNFFLFRVLPGDPARTLGTGRFRTEEQLEEFRHTYGLDQSLPAAVPHLRENTFTGRPRGLAALPGPGLAS